MPVLYALTRLHRQAMSLLAVFMIIAGSLSATSARAQVYAELDLGGVTGYGSAHPGGRTTLEIEVGPGTVEQLEFFLNFDTLGSHWALELRIRAMAPDGQERVFTGSQLGFPGTACTPCIGSSTQGFGPVSTPGTWTFEIYSTFAGSGGHFFNPGSYIRIMGASAADSLGLDLSVASATLTRGQAMTPITATATGGDEDYSFSISPALPAGLSIDANTGTISGTPTSVQAVTAYDVTVEDGTGATETASFTLEVVEDDARVAEAFEEGSAAFLSRRSERILSSEPTSWRLDARRRAGGMRDLAMRANDDGMALRFATAHVGSDGLWHVWAEGTLSRYRDATGTLAQRDGSFGMLSAGVDRLINPRLAIGLMAQIDHAGMDFGPEDRFEGTGWLAGPYLSAELTEGLFLSARAAWGQSSNRAALDIAQDGSPLFEGDFATDRTLARVTLHGRHALAGGMTLLPEIDLAWISDRQRDYTVSDGTSDVDVGGIGAERLRLGLAAALEAPLGDGRMVGFVRPALAYDRARTAGDETAFGHGSIELGLRSGAGADWRGMASIRQDGLGRTGFDATSLRLNLSRDF